MAMKVWAVGGFVDIENDADVGVVESGSGFGLADEALALLFAHAQLGREELEGDDAVELEIARAIHHAHAAAAELVKDLVVGNRWFGHGAVLRGDGFMIPPRPCPRRKLP